MKATHKIVEIHPEDCFSKPEDKYLIGQEGVFMPNGESITGFMSGWFTLVIPTRIDKLRIYFFAVKVEELS